MKYKIIHLNTTFILIIAILTASFGGALTVASVSTTQRKLPIYSVETNEKKIAITFDAAWSADDTDKLIEILEKHNAKATIFCVGDWVRKNPDAIMKFHKSGHEIGNHSDTHQSFSKISYEKVVEEIKKCNKEIESITKKAPKLCRAPSGDYDNKSVEICENMKMKMIQWDCDIIDIKVMTYVYLCDIMSIVLV